MSYVEEALLGQRQTWKKIVQDALKEGLIHSFPPEPPKRILLFGTGSSFFAAKLTALSLSRSMAQDRNRPQIPVIACSSIGIGLEVVPAKGDWAFAFSHRGQTRATLHALEGCAQAGAYTVLVAAKGVKAGRFVRLCVSTSSIEKCEPHTVGMTSAICAVTTLLMGSDAVRFWNSLSSAPNPDLKLLRDQVQQAPTLLLGEWEGEWIAHEIALKLTEMAAHRCAVFSSEEFFHGPQLLSKNLDSSDRIWYVAVPGDLREKQILADYRTEVRSSRSLAWVSSLVELQWLTLAVALNLGKNPDGMSS